MKIAFLGLGKMGLPMARLLARAPHELTVWNRTARFAEELAIPGTTIARSIAEAVTGCEVACTMLADDASTETVVFGMDGFGANVAAESLIASLPENAVHIAFGTLSVALSHRLAATHRKARQRYLAAPVFGRPNIAAAGRLWVVAAGDPATVEHVRPVLSAVGRGLTIIGSEPAQAHAFKLAGNLLISSMVQSLSEAFVFAAAQNLDCELFLDTVNEALFQSPMYASYGRVMLHPPEQPGATVALGAKDTSLLRQAASAAGVRLPLADYLQTQLDSAMAAGMERTDWAVGQFLMAQRTAKQNL